MERPRARLRLLGRAAAQSARHAARRVAVKNPSALATRYGKAFVKNLTGVSLPALKLSGPTRFGCIVGDFQIEDGVASVRNLFLESEKVVVIGSGTIDLGRDSFELRLKPKAKQPGLISLVAAVDVTGPLAAPVFKPRLRTVPGNVVRGLVSNVLAPSEALLQLFRSRAAQLCEEASRPAAPS